jgi:four helix bundle protein
MGSARELEYLLLLAQDLGYLKRNDVAQVGSDVEETKRMLAALLVKLKADR